MKIDINKFSFQQMTSNDNGKTSATGTMGVYLCTLGGITFLIGSLDFMFGSKSNDIMGQSLLLISLGAGMLGYRKFKGDSPIPDAGSEDISEKV